MAKVGHLVKEAMVKEAAERLSEAPNFFVVSVNKLSSQNSNELRQKLFGSKASLHIVKRRIGKRVLDSVGTAGLSELADQKNGSVGLVLAREDAVQVAKNIMDFIKAHEEDLTVCGGLLEGRVIGKESVKAYADLPSREVLLAQVVFTLEAPINEVCTVVERLIGDLAWVVEQAAEKVPAQKATAAGEPAAAQEKAPTQAGSSESPKEEARAGSAEEPAEGTVKSEEAPNEEVGESTDQASA